MKPPITLSILVFYNQLTCIVRRRSTHGKIIHMKQRIACRKCNPWVNAEHHRHIRNFASHNPDTPPRQRLTQTWTDQQKAPPCDACQRIHHLTVYSPIWRWKNRPYAQANTPKRFPTLNNSSLVNFARFLEYSEKRHKLTSSSVTSILFNGRAILSRNKIGDFLTPGVHIFIFQRSGCCDTSFFCQKSRLCTVISAATFEATNYWMDVK